MLQIHKIYVIFKENEYSCRRKTMADRKVKTEAELKQQLEESLKRLHPKLAEHTDKKPLLSKYAELANRKDEPKIAEKNKKKEKPLDLKGLAKKGNDLTKKAKEAGIDFTRPSIEKDDKAKEDEKKKEKEKENSSTQKRKMLNQISLPQNAHIVEHANKWEIVTKDKNGQDIATDITDVMNAIDKYNKGVNNINNMAKQPEITDKDKAKSISPLLTNLYAEDGKAVYKAPENVTPEDVPVFQSEEQLGNFINEAVILSNGDKLYKTINDRKNDNDRSQDERNIALSKLSERNSGR